MPARGRTRLLALSVAGSRLPNGDQNPAGLRTGGQSWSSSSHIPLSYASAVAAKSNTLMFSRIQWRVINGVLVSLDAWPMPIAEAASPCCEVSTSPKEPRICHTVRRTGG